MLINLKVYFFYFKKNKLINVIIGYLLVVAQSGKWKYEPHVRTPQTREEEIAEIIREKIYQRTHNEVPYTVQQQTENIEENDEKMVINQILYAKSRGNMKLLNGSAMVFIKRQATRHLMNRFGKEIDLRFKVRLSDG